MRRIAAHYVWCKNNEIIPKGVVTLSDSGKVLEIGKLSNDSEMYGLEFYNGILVPGFVNAHCHLELSYMQNLIPKPLGLADFLFNVGKNKSKNNDEIIDKALWADHYMFKNGIRAIGDISNTSITSEIKNKSAILYHTFIEMYGLHDDKAQEIFESHLPLLQNFNPSSLTLHTTYSVSEKLLNLFSSYLKKNNSISSIHFKESEQENMHFNMQKGELFDFLKRIKPDLQASKTSIEILQKTIPKNNHLLLVHNTICNKSEIENIESQFSKVFWVLCPRSNMYISQTLPDFSIFQNGKTCLGTDSLASNSSLSILDELIFIQQNWDKADLNTLLTWATSNGAEALQMEAEIGSIEIGKNPGIVLIENADLQGFRLKENTTCKRLI